MIEREADRPMEALRDARDAALMLYGALSVATTATPSGQEGLLREAGRRLWPEPPVFIWNGVDAATQTRSPS